MTYSNPKRIIWNHKEGGAALYHNSCATVKIILHDIIIDINECDSDPCQNSATCTDVVNAFSCSCENGYTGTLCETGNYCIHIQHHFTL